MRVLLMLLGCVVAAAALPTGPEASSQARDHKSLRELAVKNSHIISDLAHTSPSKLRERTPFGEKGILKRHQKAESLRSNEQKHKGMGSVFGRFPAPQPANDLRQVGGTEFPWTCSEFQAYIAQVQTNFTAVGGTVDANQQTCMNSLSDLYCVMVAGSTGCDRTAAEALSPLTVVFSALQALEGGAGSPNLPTEAALSGFCTTTGTANGCGTEGFYAKAKQFEVDYFTPTFAADVATCEAFFLNSLQMDTDTADFVAEQMGTIAMITSLSCVADGNNYCTDDYGQSVIDGYPLMGAIGSETADGLPPAWTDAQTTQLTSACSNVDCVDKMSSGLDSLMFVLEALVPAEDRDFVMAFLFLLYSPSITLSMFCITDPNDPTRFCMAPYTDFLRTTPEDGFDKRICEDACIAQVMFEQAAVSLAVMSVISEDQSAAQQLELAISQISLQLTAGCAKDPATGDYCGVYIADQTKLAMYIAFAASCGGPQSPYDVIPDAYGSTCSPACETSLNSWIEPTTGWGCCVSSLLFSTPMEFQAKTKTLLTACSITAPETCEEGFVINWSFEVPNLKFSGFQGLWATYQSLVENAFAKFFKVNKDLLVVGITQISSTEGTSFDVQLKFSNERAFQNFIKAMEEYEAEDARRAGAAVDVSSGMTFLSTVPADAKVDAAQPMTATGATSQMTAAKVTDPTATPTSADFVSATDLAAPSTTPTGEGIFSSSEIKL